MIIHRCEMALRMLSKRFSYKLKFEATLFLPCFRYLSLDASVQDSASVQDFLKHIIIFSITCRQNVYLNRTIFLITFKIHFREKSQCG